MLISQVIFQSFDQRKIEQLFMEQYHTHYRLQEASFPFDQKVMAIHQQRNTLNM